MGLLSTFRGLASALVGADSAAQASGTGTPSLLVDGAAGYGGALWTRARTIVRNAGSIATAFSEIGIDPTTGGLWVALVGGSGTTVVANPTPSTPSSSSVLAASLVLKASAGTFRSLLVQIDASAPSGTYYVLLGTASTTVPGNGAVTLLRPPITVEHVVNFPDYVTFDEGDAGILFTVGCWSCLSTTQFTKTVAGAYGLFSGSAL